MATSHLIGVGAFVLLAGNLAAQPCTGTWTLISPTGPRLTTGSGVTFDEARGELVQHGGTRWGPSFDEVRETWVWDGVSWSQRSSIPGTTFLYHGAMAYDALNEVIVLAGGAAYCQSGCNCSDGCQFPVQETWLWDGTSWTASVNGPGRASEHEMAYDPIRGVCVLHRSNWSGVGEETWEFDGTTWQRRQTGGVNAAGCLVAWDPIRERVIMFGGNGGGGPNPTTWEWTGSSWSRISTPVQPTGRAGGMIATDLDRRRVVVFGGERGNSSHTLMNDTWEWDGQRWWQITVPNPPAGRYSVNGAYDTVNKRVLMVGGFDDDAFITFAETWAYHGPDVPVILDHSGNKSACLGGSLALNITANPGDWTYQWRRNGIDLIDGARISGAQTATLIIDPFEEADAGDFTCIVSCPCGTAATQAIMVSVGCCPADLTTSSDPSDPTYGAPDGALDGSDFFYYLDQFVAGNTAMADLTTSSDPNHPTYGTPDGVIDGSDFFYYLDLFSAGCP